MDIRLISKQDTVTSRGMLSKGWYLIDKEICMVKGNSIENGISGYEPYCEVIASRIGKLLEFDCIPYTIIYKEKFPEIKVYDIKHLSICKDFIPKGCRSMSMYKFITSKTFNEPSDWFVEIGKYFNMKIIYQMIVLDAFICNEDRHLNNIEVIINSNGDYTLAPIFDNGASLLSWHEDNEITNLSALRKIDSAKPFRTKHESQLKLVPKGFLPHINLDNFFEDILKENQDIFKLLPEHRAKAIKDFLKIRLKYLRKVMAE